jgi:glycolate oxidase iron-sulfur subunit
MRSLERGEMSPSDPGLLEHLEGCLGCRGCEPACPSGVGYGRGLEAAREQIFHARGLSPLARLVLGVFRYGKIWHPLFAMARALRATGLPHLLSGKGRLGFGMGMLASSAEMTEQAEKRRALGQQGSGPGGQRESGAGALWAGGQPQSTGEVRGISHTDALTRRLDTLTVVLFRGCVMNALFSHVHEATKRTLQVNGYRVIEAGGQVCCGALHEHAGDVGSARSLAAANVAALEGGADFIVVNSAGCGALLKDYGRLLGSDAAANLGAKVRDVSELLAERGPRPGAPIGLDVAYDAPCHLQHAQHVHEAPLAMLEAIPGLRLRILPGSDRCCGSAGIYSVLRPAMARAVLDSKIASVAEARPRPDLIVTGNPGCLMQIGAGLRAARLPIGVAHPVELLDLSYDEAGFYG